MASSQGKIPVLRIAAPHMYAAAVAFRQDFVTNYLGPQKPYPIANGLRATKLRPDSPAAQRLLLARGAIQISGTSLKNDDGSQVEAQFNPVVNNKSFTIAILFPKPFSANVTTSETELAFSFETPMSLTFVSKPDLPGASAIIPERAVVDGISVSESALIFNMTSVDGGKFLILNDFGQPSLRRQNFLEHHDYRIFKDAIASTGASLHVMDVGGCGDQQWYVFRGKDGTSLGGICVVHQGTTIEGANGYDLVFGPGTADQANAYANDPNNCPPG